MRIILGMIGALMFLQANYWLLYTSTSLFVCYSWGLVGVLVFLGSTLSSYRVRG